jgi:hypothetical protein
MPFFAYLGVKNGIYFCGKHIFLLGKHKTLQEASETHFVVRIGLETLTSAALSWV